MRMFLLLALVFLAACGRPLTKGEKTFANQIYGPSIDTHNIRLIRGALVGKVTFRRQKRPRLACRERIFPEPTEEIVTTGPAAVALHNKVFFTKPFYTNDYLRKYPARVHLFAAMLFAHEITHVWQWQNRAKTGYSPLKAASEHAPGKDPYLYDITTKTSLLDYPYEQQASIVEEYICCATLDPTAPRTKRLETMLKGSFPLGKLTLPKDIDLPWKGAETKNICH